MHRNRLLLAVLVVLVVSGTAFSDTLYLKNGKSFEGKVVSESGGKVKFKTTSNIIMEFAKSEVDRIEKGATKADEYSARLGKIPPDDLDTLLELARWCHENRLYKQKKSVYRTILKKCPDHPETRREQSQVWTDGKWKRAPKGLEESRVEGGDRLELKDAGAALVLPKDWKVKTEGKTVTATGPARYKVSPVLTVAFGEAGGDPKSAFPEKDGWEKPAEVAASGLNGLASKRVVFVDHIARVERVAVLRDRRTGVTARLTCLRLEGGAFFSSLDLVLKTLKVEGPPADYANKHYDYAMDLPKGGGWKHNEDKNHDIHIGHSGTADTDWARMSIWSAKTADEKREVQQMFDGTIAGMKSGGDINVDGEIVLGGVKGRVVDGTSLASGGYPIRVRVAMVTHKKRLYLLQFSQHEFGQKKTNDAWEIVTGSFRFTD